LESGERERVRLSEASFVPLVEAIVFVLSFELTIVEVK
jgi:hypothetical protein